MEGWSFTRSSIGIAMSWHQIHLRRLAEHPCCGYREEAPATEPTALSALALLMDGQRESAEIALDWLVSIQAADGSGGVRANEPALAGPPVWPFWPGLQPEPPRWAVDRMKNQFKRLSRGL